MYIEDDLLMLSGIQHFAFCERQWALIHMEKQWQENRLTIEGKLIHEKVDNPFLKEKRRGLLIARALPLVSYNLGLYGIADVVEFNHTDEAKNSVKVSGKRGFWKVAPVEYKRGKPKNTDCDKIQLCAQAICLEEQYGIQIDLGYIFYDARKRREAVLFNSELRLTTKSAAKRMHKYFLDEKTPRAIKKPCCDSCSLKEVCVPALSQLSASKYLRDNLL